MFYVLGTPNHHKECFIFIFNHCSKIRRITFHLHICSLLHIVFVFFPMMYIIDIVKRGSAYKHLLLLLPFQSDNENFVTC